MIVNNTTHISKDNSYNTLVSQERKTYITKSLFTLVMLGGGIYFLIMGIINNEQKATYLAGGIIFLVFGLLFSAYQIYTFIKIPEKIKKNQANTVENDSVYNFQFKEKSFNVVIVCNNKRDKREFSYDDVSKVLKYEDKYVLKCKSGLVITVSRDGFENKRMEEFFISNLNKNKKKIVNKIKEVK